MNSRMLRLGCLAWLACAVPTGLAGCSPQVVLARYDAEPVQGGAGGAPPDDDGDDPNLGGAAPGAETARILADSVGDFSLEQGKYGWYYGSDGGSLDSFELLTEKSVVAGFDPPSKDVWECWRSSSTYWTQIFQIGAHPNGTITSSPPSVARLSRAVRRWVSDVEGNVVITGEAGKLDVGDSNGVDVLVYVDGTEVYGAFIAGNDGPGHTYELRGSVRVGSTVDFVLDPHEGADAHDLSRFTAVITRDAPSEPE